MVLFSTVVTDFAPGRRNNSGQEIGSSVLVAGYPGCLYGQMLCFGTLTYVSVWFKVLGEW